jgi:hypothetical protein
VRSIGPKSGEWAGRAIAIKDWRVQMGRGAEWEIRCQRLILRLLCDFRCRWSNQGESCYENNRFGAGRYDTLLIFIPKTLHNCRPATHPSKAQSATLTHMPTQQAAPRPARHVYWLLPLWISASAQIKAVRSVYRPRTTRCWASNQNGDLPLTAAAYPSKLESTLRDR